MSTISIAKSVLTASASDELNEEIKKELENYNDTISTEERDQSIAKHIIEDKDESA